MNEYRYTPVAKNRHARILSVALTLAGILTFVLFGYLPCYVGVLRVASILLVVSGIFIAAKFVFTERSYALMTAEDGVSYFLVEEVQGKRNTLLCQIPLARIKEVRSVRAGEKLPNGRCFTYVATFGLREYQLVIATADDRRTLVVKIEADETFLTEFSGRLAALSRDE